MSIVVVVTRNHDTYIVMEALCYTICVRVDLNELCLASALFRRGDHSYAHPDAYKSFNERFSTEVCDIIYPISIINAQIYHPKLIVLLNLALLLCESLFNIYIFLV